MIVLTDIGVTQSSSFHNYINYPRLHHFFTGKVSNFRFLHEDKRWVSFENTFKHLGNLNFNLGRFEKSKRLFINAVATFEPKCHVQDFEGEDEGEGEGCESLVSNVDCCDGDLEDVGEREKLRRLRISKANKGNTPWNKGRKHSPETLQRIKERTRLAMQNPKVKMKLANMGHAQSEETREKIAAGVRIGWQKRREKLTLQETCLFEWQNLIAEASRKGFQDEEELQWDSYKILSEQLQKEWLDSVEFRKSRPRPKGSKRAPKSLEQRKKIAESIAAKWADPDYRTRVTSGLAKYYGIPEGVERKPRRKRSSSGSGEPRAPRAPKKTAGEADVKSANGMKASPQQPKLKKRIAPKYKDPLASYKLEMLKSIRAQRGVTESKKIEALQRAKLLIAEAEKAAKALEFAAARSPVAQASLIESKKLIAEAIQSIQSIENFDITSQDNLSSGQQIYDEMSEESVKEGVNQLHQNGMNGVASVKTSNEPGTDFNLYELTMLDKTDMNYRVPTKLSGYDVPNPDLEKFTEDSDSTELKKDEQHFKSNGAIKMNDISSPNVSQLPTQKKTPFMTKPVTKKWVCGRLVDVEEVEVNV